MKKFDLRLLPLAFLFLSARVHGETISALSADNGMVTLNEPHKISVIVSSNQETQQLTRTTGRILDEFQGLPDFREIVVVDLQTSVGSLLPSIVRMEMRDNLDDEAKRIRPFFRAHHNPHDPRLSTIAIPDFDGRVSQALGWRSPDALVRVVVFDRSAQPVFRWRSDQSPDLLHHRVQELLR